MTLRELQNVLEANPGRFPRFVLPDGDYIPAHAHVTEVGHVVRTFIDCGGLTGKEEKALLQTHVGNDTDHRLRSDRFAKILVSQLHLLEVDRRHQRRAGRTALERRERFCRPPRRIPGIHRRRKAVSTFDVTHVFTASVIQVLAAGSRRFPCVRWVGRSRRGWQVLNITT